MLDRVCQFCQKRLTATVLLTFVIEAVTLFFRFGLGLESTKHTASTVGKLTMGIRFHHGYAGIILLMLLLSDRLKKHRVADVIFVVGMSLFVSDIIHHTLLYLITGSADLDLVYPGTFQ